MRVLVTLLALMALTPASARAQITPDQDPFYAAPADLARRPNGAVLRTRAVSVALPLVTATQILYRSTDAKGTPIAAATTLMVPVLPYFRSGPRPLVGYQVGYDSLGAQCAPSYTLRTGNQKELPQLLSLLQLGYAVAAPDYEGPSNAWLAGPLAGHTVLDNLRAVQSLPDTGLTGAATPTALFGYSGGGQASAWAAEQAAIYAPELSIAGVVAGAVTPDPLQLIRTTDGTPRAGIALAALFGLARQFPELNLDGLLNTAGQAARSALGGQCFEQFAGAYTGTVAAVENAPIPDPLLRPRAQRVFEANRLGRVAPTMPIYLFHSTADEVFPVSGSDALATRWCVDGAFVFYQRDTTGDHQDHGLVGSLQAFSYLADRFAGVPAASNCGRTPEAQIASYCPGGATEKFRLLRIRGERVRRVVVRLDGRRVGFRRGVALRRIVIRRLVPGTYTFTVTRSTRHHRRTNTYQRTVVCKERAI
jgi:hypothetical protein